MPIFCLALISHRSMVATCSLVFGHHFSQIKSHFNDLKQNFKIWGYLQKRIFTIECHPTTQGMRYNYEGLAQTTSTDSTFSWKRNGANHFTPKRENLGQIWNLVWKIQNFFFFSLFLIFRPKYLALVDNFQCQEDLILWNFLCGNFGKKMSADFSCLFTFFKKNIFFFKFC